MKHSCLTILIWLLTLSSALAEQPDAVVPPVNEARFLQGLRERGLDAWIETYKAANPPATDIETRIRKRDALLEKAGTHAPGSKATRACIEQAHDILVSLINEAEPAQVSPDWLIESARDNLERRHPAVFDKLLLFELPGRCRQQARTLSVEADAHLTQARKMIQLHWQRIESLDETQLQHVLQSGFPRLLEMQGQQCAYLQAWARFYKLISQQETNDSISAFAALRSEVDDRHRWTTDKEVVKRCSALLIAAVAARHANQPQRADDYAKQIILAADAKRDSRTQAQLKQLTLLAVLEQIRNRRDRGAFEEGLQILERADQWRQKSRPDDLEAAAALALLERSLLAAQGSKEKSQTPDVSSAADFEHSAISWLAARDSLKPLEELAEVSIQHRTALYQILTGAFDPEHPAVASAPSSAPARTTDNESINALTRSLSPFALQLLMGSVVVDDSSEEAPSFWHRYLSEIASAAADAADTVSTSSDKWIHGELMYLAGLAWSQDGQKLKAASEFCRLAEHLPSHDRAHSAANQATRISEAAIRSHPDGQPERLMFIRSARLLRSFESDRQLKHDLTLAVAVALERDQQYAEAAEEYGQAAGLRENNAVTSLVGQARCLHRLYMQSVENKTRDQQQLKSLGERAITAAGKVIDSASVADSQLAADTQAQIIQARLILATLLNHPQINQPERALAAWADLAIDQVKDDALKARILEAQILSHTRLGQFSNASELLDEYVTSDPPHASYVLTQLMAAAWQKLIHTEDQGDPDQIRAAAEETATLASAILKQVRGKDIVSQTAQLTIDVRYAWALLKSGQVEQATEVFKKLSSQLESQPQPALQVELTLGQAFCLLHQHHPEKALEQFAEVWKAFPEHSDPWWRAYVGMLRCHTQLGHDPKGIVQSIRQQKVLEPKLGSPRWARQLESLEKTNLDRMLNE